MFETFEVKNTSMPFDLLLTTTAVVSPKTASDKHVAKRKRFGTQEGPKGPHLSLFVIFVCLVYEV